MSIEPAPDPSALCSDAEREQAVVRLRDGAVTGRLTLEELADRVGKAYASRTRLELDAVTADLPADQGSAAMTPTPRRRRWLVAIFGKTRPRGRWHPGEHVSALALFGGVDIDLREAEVAASETRISAVALFGGIDVIVPSGVQVDVHGFGLFGGVDGENNPAAPVGAPRIAVTGFALFGGVSLRIGGPTH